MPKMHATSVAIFHCWLQAWVTVFSAALGCKVNQIEALMQCSLKLGMISQKDYEEIMAIDDDER